MATLSTFNIEDGLAEGLLRGFRIGFLTDAVSLAADGPLARTKQSVREQGAVGHINCLSYYPYHIHREDVRQKRTELTLAVGIPSHQSVRHT